MSLHGRQEERRGVNQGTMSAEALATLLSKQPYLERISVSEGNGCLVVAVPEVYTPLGTSLKDYAEDTIAHHIGASCSAVNDGQLGATFVVTLPGIRPFTVVVQEDTLLAVPSGDARTFTIRRSLAEQRVEPQSIAFLDHEGCVLVTLAKPGEMFQALILLDNKLGFVRSEAEGALYFIPPPNSEWLPIKLVLGTSKGEGGER